MKLEFLKKCLDENRKIQREGLAKLSWGNYSCIDREENLVYIKPSGANLLEITEKDISVVDLKNNHISGMKCSVDTPIHLAIYKKLQQVKSVCHTHSTYATAYSQSGRTIEMYGTTHADVSAGPIRNVDAPLNIYELGKDHEKSLGDFIADNLKEDDSCAILVKHHGPFTWSESYNAVDHAIAIEEIAKMACLTESLGCKERIPQEISSFHWQRKHGKEKWYGQDRN